MIQGTLEGEQTSEVCAAEGKKEKYRCSKEFSKRAKEIIFEPEIRAFVLPSWRKA